MTEEEQRIIATGLVTGLTVGYITSYFRMDESSSEDDFIHRTLGHSMVWGGYGWFSALTYLINPVLFGFTVSSPFLFLTLPACAFRYKRR